MPCSKGKYYGPLNYYLLFYTVCHCKYIYTSQVMWVNNRFKCLSWRGEPFPESEKQYFISNCLLPFTHKLWYYTSNIWDILILSFTVEHICQPILTHIMFLSLTPLHSLWKLCISSWISALLFFHFPFIFLKGKMQNGIRQVSYVHHT